jgi:hypothetical protein
MSNNIHPIHHSPPRSRWRIFWCNPLLPKIVVWLGSLSFITSTGVVWAEVQPVVTFKPAPQSIGQKVSPTVAAAAAAIVPPRKIVRPHHTDLLTADNYVVGANGSATRPNMAQASIEISVPPPRQHTILDRAKESIKPTKSQIAPNFKTKATAERSEQAKLETQRSIDRDRLFAAENVEAVPDRLSAIENRSWHLPTTIAKKIRSITGLKSNIVTPMKPRSPRGKSQFKPPATLTVDPGESIDKIAVETSSPQPQLRKQPIETPILKGSDFQPQLAFSQPKPIIFDDAGAIDPTSKNLDAPKIEPRIERLAKISNLQVTNPSFQPDPLAPPDLPKQKFDLAPNTQLAVGVTDFDVNDFTDTIDPLFDPKIQDSKTSDDNLISRFGTRAGIYALVAGSGIGIRHRFSPTLEGSVGVLARSNEDNTNNQADRSGNGGSGNNNQQNNRTLDNANNFNDNGLPRGGLSDSYGTIAQLTYTPSQEVKIGLTYVYGYNTYPEIGSDNANITDGGTSAVGLQTFARLSSKLALGGRIGFNRNINSEFDKNIFTWAVTTAIPDLGGKGNLAGIIIGQAPRVTSASDLNVVDTGNAFHVEGFYKIEINKDFSITPAIVYLTGPNIDNVAADASSIIGAIGVNYKF